MSTIHMTNKEFISKTCKILFLIENKMNSKMENEENACHWRSLKQAVNKNNKNFSKSSAGPMAEWLSSCAPLWRTRFQGFGSWALTWHHSSGHAEVASHIAQPEALTTRIYSWVLGGFGEKNKKKRKKKKISNSC